MAYCEVLEQSRRDEPVGDGEKDYREHVSAHRLSFGEIIVVVAAVVMLAGMGLVHRETPQDRRTTASISASHTTYAGAPTRCDDDNHYLAQTCER